MSEFFDERELEKKVKLPPHDYSKGIEKLDEKIRKTQFKYIDAVLGQVRKVRRRAIALIIAGLAVAIVTLLTANFFPAYDADAYIFLNSFIPIGYNPIISVLSIMIPAVIVFAFLVWLYNRETSAYLYLAKKTSEAEKKRGFLVMLAKPFLILITAIAAVAILLTLFSFLGCQHFVCHFFDNADRFSSNLLFNLLSLAFYLIILGALQLKRYIELVKMGIKDFYKDIEL